MRIALISPYSRGPMRGNITTVRRIHRALRLAGHELAELPIDAMDAEEIKITLKSFGPDIVHGFHAAYCGATACDLAAYLHVPCVITVTGSDINDPKFREQSDTQHAIEAAAAVVCFDDNVATLVSRYFPASTGRIVIIPQGVAVLPEATDAGFSIPEDSFVLLLPAALRPVKNIEFCVRALAPLARENSRLVLIVAGGVIDQVYAEMIERTLADAPFASWIGPVPYEMMGALYARADVVLNSSHYEGMPNSLLEAMSLARPVLAADIPGNHSLIHDGETGWLYRDEVEFRELVLQLMGDPDLRRRVGERGREYVQSKYSPVMEAERYTELFIGLRRKAESHLGEMS